METWLACRQRRLGVVGLVCLLVITSLVTPLSLDMYTPAIPHMTDYFDADAGTVNLTLVDYYLFFAVGLLLFGPVSDRLGRKPVLIGGVVAYVVASVLCAMAFDIWMLVVTRVLQALGAGATSAVSTAVVKDAIAVDKREAVLSVVQVMFVIGPVLAPVVGALVLQVADWRMTFWVLALIGSGCLVLVLLFEETLPAEERVQTGALGTLKNLAVVAKNKGFTVFLLVTALFNLPFMAYIAVGSYVYITFFGLSELAYSCYFAVAALVTATGPLIWLFASRFVSARTFTTIMIAVGAAAGGAMLALGSLSPVLFCLTFVAFALAEACIRPYSTNILLSQQEHDTGAAASLINFAHTAVGSVGMLVAVMPWPNFVVGIGVIIVVTMAAAGGDLVGASALQHPARRHRATSGHSGLIRRIRRASRRRQRALPNRCPNSQRDLRRAPSRPSPFPPAMTAFCTARRTGHIANAPCLSGWPERACDGHRGRQLDAARGKLSARKPPTGTVQRECAGEISADFGALRVRALSPSGVLECHSIMALRHVVPIDEFSSRKRVEAGIEISEPLPVPFSRRGSHAPALPRQRHCYGTSSLRILPAAPSPRESPASYAGRLGRREPPWQAEKEPSRSGSCTCPSSCSPPRRTTPCGSTSWRRTA